VWLYRIWPQVIDEMVLVKPATVIQWHRKGFRLYWRWRSRCPRRTRLRKNRQASAPWFHFRVQRAWPSAVAKTKAWQDDTTLARSGLAAWN
jgi:hypothetical protein